MEVLEDQQDILRDRGQSHREPKKHPKLVKRLTRYVPTTLLGVYCQAVFFAISV